MRGITMRGRGFDGMREAELNVLEDTRVQAGKVARLRARCSVIVEKGAYQSPSFSGMPGGGAPSGLDGSSQKCEKLLIEAEREEARLKALVRQAEKIIAKSDMKPEMRAFCRAYYIERQSVEEAAQSAGMTGRTGWNYKAEIEGCRRAKNAAHTRKNEAKNAQKNFQ